MSFAQFLAIVTARWKWALGVFACTVLGVLLITLVWPKRYTASAVVVVDSRPDPVAGTLSSLIVPGFMATQAEIFESDRVAQRVVRNLRMGESLQTRLEWEEETKGTGSVEAWLGERLTRHFKVKPSRESNLITVSYTSDTPQDAAHKANAFVQAFQDVNLELRTDPARQYSNFFDTRARQLRDELEQAQSRLSAYQREKSILASEERYDVEMARLNDLSTQLVALQGLASESSSRQNQARKSVGQLQEVLSNPLVASLKADLSRLQAKLREMNSQLGDAHPQVIQIKANIEETQVRLNAEIARIGGGVGVTNTINQAREADVRAALEAQRAKVLQMKELRDQLAVLENDVVNAQKAYDSVATRLSQTVLESENKMPSVAVLTPAAVPTKPSSPSWLLNMFLAVFGGLFLACAAAIWIENQDRRVRTADDLTRMLNIGIIGHLGQPGERRLLGRRRASGGSLGSQLMRPLPRPATE